MMIRRFAIVGLCVTAVTAAVLAMQAFGQYQVEPRIRYEEETIDRTLPDGKVERITVKVPVQENVVVQSAGGRYGVRLAQQPLDAEGQKLLLAEQAVAQEARKLASEIQGAAAAGIADADRVAPKKQLRDKLAAIFDLQQQRRTREIAKIEERLGKLKEVVKKRDSAKDSIVDRRLETLTGGVDELGWEESLPTSLEPLLEAAPSFVPQRGNPLLPTTNPVPSLPLPPALDPAPETAPTIPPRR